MKFSVLCLTTSSVWNLEVWVVFIQLIIPPYNPFFIAYIFSPALDYLCTKFHFNRFCSFLALARQTDRRSFFRIYNISEDCFHCEKVNYSLLYEYIYCSQDLYCFLYSGNAFRTITSLERRSAYGLPKDQSTH